MHWKRWVGMVVVVAALVGCARTQTGVQGARDAISQAVGDGGARAYVEAVMMARIEEWKDDEAKIVNVYFFNPATGALLINPVRCIGTPVSTSEDLEPGLADPRGASSWWVPPLFPGDVGMWTNEVAGRDSTFGDEVPGYECLTVDGQYMRWPATFPALVSSASYTFAPPTVQRDLASEIQLEQARAIIQRGGCVNPETLQEQPCPAGGGAGALEPVAPPTVTPEGQ
jgi:hypothetical protein